MFSINNITENGFDKIILKDNINGTTVQVVPSCGAILHSFSATIEGNQFNVIDSYESKDDFRQNVTKGFLGTKLSPFVCRLNKGQYRFEGREFRIEKNYDGNNALHGLLYDQTFRVINQKVSEQRAFISMIHEYRAMDKGYPFNYDSIVTYELEKDNRLDVITETINRDEVAIPIQDGWHPYFKLNSKIDDLELQFQSIDMVEFNDELIPTGKLNPYKEFYKPRKLGNTFLDNCFTLNFSEGQPICLLQNTEKNVQIEIHTNESYPYLQFYTPPHRNSIAIENISGPPDAFNNGLALKILPPGESVTFKTSYKISSVS